MRFHPNELFIFYDPKSNTGKQTRAYAYSITKHVNEVSFEHARFSSTRWREILQLLNLRAKDLMNRAHPEYQSKLAGNNYNEEDWLNIIIKHPYLIKAPIAVKNRKAVLCVKPTEILKLS